MGILKNNLRRLRFEKGQMTQQELAEALGVSRQTIISIEKGKYMPSILLAMKMARYFGKTVEEIFFIDPNEDQ
ncbi:MAG: transcriptional regulator [Bacteroidetes bacterium]|nr:MAG: transcriptional regulator [Bacteroidota bacterium]